MYIWQIKNYLIISSVVCDSCILTVVLYAQEMYDMRVKIPTSSSGMCIFIHLYTSVVHGRCAKNWQPTRRYAV